MFAVILRQGILIQGSILKLKDIFVSDTSSHISKY